MNEKPRDIERRLRDLVADAPETAEVSPETAARIEARLLEGLKPVRPVPSRAVLTLGFFLIFTIVAVAFIAAVGLKGAAAKTAVQLAATAATTLAFATLAAYSLSGEIVPGDKRIAGPGLMAGGLAAVIGSALALLYPWSGGLAGTWECFRAGFAFSIPAAILVYALARRGAPLGWSATGATAGLLSGLAGMLVLDLGCPLTGAPHLALGHLGVPMAVAALGYLMGKALRRRVSAGSGS